MVSCSNCGEDSVETDSSTGELVCTECCVVQKEDHFQYDHNLNANKPTEINDTGIPKRISRRMAGRMKRIPEGQKNAHSQLKDLAKEFKLRADMLAEAERLLTDALKHRQFHNIRIDKKIVLAGCCVYAIMRKHSLPVQLSTVASKLRQVDLPKMAFVHKRLKIAFPDALETVVAPTASDALATFLTTSKLQNDLLPCMTKLVQLLNRELLSTCVHLDPLFVAIAYVAWRSQIQNVNTKLGLEKFCAAHSLCFSKACHIRLQEIITLLVALCKDLPWLRDCKIDKKNVFGHVDSVLSNSHVLLHNKEDLPKRQSRHTPRADGATSDVPEAELVVSTSTELSDADLPDSEMDNYIYSNEEVTARKRDKELLQIE